MPGFKIHPVCVSGVVSGVMHRGRALAEKQTSDAARSGNAAARHRTALSVAVEGVRRESVYISHIVLKSSSAIIYFQAVEKTFSFFMWILHLFPASCFQLTQFCFLVCVFFSS